MTCETCYSRRTVLTTAAALGSAGLVSACSPDSGSGPAPLAQSSRTADDPVITDPLPTVAVVVDQAAGVVRRG